MTYSTTSDRLNHVRDCTQLGTELLTSEEKVAIYKHLKQHKEAILLN